MILQVFKNVGSTLSIADAYTALISGIFLIKFIRRKRLQVLLAEQ